jgi:hypothetical protein
MERGYYAELNGNTHQSNRARETKLDLHRLGNRKFDAVIGKLGKKGPKT